MNQAPTEDKRPTEESSPYIRKNPADESNPYIRFAQAKGFLL